MATELYDKIPEKINYRDAFLKNNPNRDNDALKIVLLQEISRYNILLGVVKGSFDELMAA